MEIKFFKAHKSEVNSYETLGTVAMSLTEAFVTGDLGWLAFGDMFQ